MLGVRTVLSPRWGWVLLYAFPRTNVRGYILAPLRG